MTKDKLTIIGNKLPQITSWRASNPDHLAIEYDDICMPRLSMTLARIKAKKMALFFS